MTRHDALDIDLQPWMARNAPPAPDDLLLRVMREVDTVSQRTRTWSTGWLTMSHTTAWVTATAAVAVLAVAAGLFFFNTSPPVGGPQATPTATLTPTNAPTPTPDLAPPVSVQAAIDGNITAWSTGNDTQVYSLFVNGGSARIAIDDSTWTEAYVGREAIAETLLERGSNVNTHRTGQILRIDSLAAHTVTWVETTEKGQGIAVYDLNAENRIHSFWVVGMRVDKLSPAVPAPESVLALADGCLAAVSAGDTLAWSSCFDTNGELLLMVGSGNGDLVSRFQGTAVIANYAVDALATQFKVTRKGDGVMEGDMVAYPYSYTSIDGGGSGIVVYRLTPDHTKILYQWVFGT